jgi:hypothetical protein
MSGFEAIKHTDVLHAVDEQALLARDEEIAQENLERNYPENGANPIYADHLAHMLAFDRARRNSHHYRYKLMTQAAMYGSLFDDQENFPEASLLDLDTRTASMTDEDKQRAAVYGGKGISLELGHVDQLGDWDAAKPLDGAIRMLPRSERLASAGFVFGDTYDVREKAKTTYKFYLSDREYRGAPVVRAVRRRAVADILTEAGHEYEIVKSSSFLINDGELSPSQQRRLHEARRPSTSKVEAGKVFTGIGLDIVEPFIGDSDLRQRSTAVLAIHSLYFALRRH